jgi:RNA 2',3'-cyclic 3'-phosphodiesterase
MKTIYPLLNSQGHSMEVFRGFIALEVPVTDQILQFQRDIKKTEANVKLVEPENIHITLKFLGDTPVNQIDMIESIMNDAVSSVKKHMVTLEGTGVFPNENYIKVIWIGIRGTEKLSEIADVLNKNCTKIGVKKDKRGFSAHLTIGRMKSAQGKDQIINLLRKYENALFAEIPVNHIDLKKSTLTPKGPIYETLKTVSFKD